MIPSNEENLAFLAILCSHKVEVVDAVATFFNGEASSEILVGLSWLADFFNNNLLLFLLDLEDHVAISPFRLQF